MISQNAYFQSEYFFTCWMHRRRRIYRRTYQWSDILLCWLYGRRKRCLHTWFWWASHLSQRSKRTCSPRSSIMGSSLRTRKISWDIYSCWKLSRLDFRKSNRKVSYEKSKISSDSYHIKNWPIGPLRSWFLLFRNFNKGKSLASQNPSVKLPDSILVQTLDILGQARTVNKRTNGNSREIPMIPILGKSLEKIQHRIGKIQNRVGNLVTANVGSESVDFTPNRKVMYRYLIYMVVTT